MTNFEIIFDNGGGATLQVNGQQFVHNYDDMGQLAQDVMAVVSGANTACFDGHEPESYISDERFWAAKANGGYRCIDQDDYADTDHLDSGWANIAAFAQAIGRQNGAVKTLYVIEQSADSENRDLVPDGEFSTIKDAQDGLQALERDLGWRSLRIAKVLEINGAQRTNAVIEYGAVE